MINEPQNGQIIVTPMRGPPTLVFALNRKLTLPTDPFLQLHHDHNVVRHLVRLDVRVVLKVLRHPAGTFYERLHLVPRVENVPIFDIKTIVSFVFMSPPTLRSAALLLPALFELLLEHLHFVLDLHPSFDAVHEILFGRHTITYEKWVYTMTLDIVLFDTVQPPN